jgi:hypothetical protein
MQAPARVAVAVSGVLTIGACASPPRNPPADTNINTVSVGFRDSDSNSSVDLRHRPDVGESIVPAGLRSVWVTLPEVFEQLEIEVNHVDASQGTLGNTGYHARRVEGERMSRWLDCGRGLVRAIADEYQVTLSVVVQLLPARADSTAVRTTVDAYARDRSLGSSSIHCVSWGRLERRVGELVLERLGG